MRVLLNISVLLTSEGIEPIGISSLTPFLESNNAVPATPSASKLVLKFEVHRAAGKALFSLLLLSSCADGGYISFS